MGQVVLILELIIISLRNFPMIQRVKFPYVGVFLILHCEILTSVEGAATISRFVRNCSSAIGNACESYIPPKNSTIRDVASIVFNNPLSFVTKI